MSYERIRERAEKMAEAVWRIAIIGENLNKVLQDLGIARSTFYRNYYPIVAKIRNYETIYKQWYEEKKSEIEKLERKIGELRAKISWAKCHLRWALDSINSWINRLEKKDDITAQFFAGILRSIAADLWKAYRELL